MPEGVLPLSSELPTVLEELPLSLASLSEGVLPLSLEPLTVLEEPPGGEQATTPAKMNDKELRIGNFFIMNTPRRCSKK